MIEFHSLGNAVNIMAEETTPNTTPEVAEGKEATAKPAAAKAAKKPALEEKPFSEFIQQDFTPALKQALAQEGLGDVQLTFTQANLPILGASVEEKYWQVIGNWQQGQRQFNLYFLEGDINGKKAFSAATSGKLPSTLESFMIDERKVTLELLLLYTRQRLNSQKWLARN
jgi:hypothetical protein